MAVHKNSLKNLKKAVPFKEGDSRIQRGRTTGVQNRHAVMQEWLDITSDCLDPKGNNVQIPQADQIALVMIYKAKTGDVSAANFVFDSAYGKVSNMPLPEPAPEPQQIDWSKYTDEELMQLTALMEKGRVVN